MANLSRHFFKHALIRWIELQSVAKIESTGPFDMEKIIVVHERKGAWLIGAGLLVVARRQFDKITHLGSS